MKQNVCEELRKRCREHEIAANEVFTASSIAEKLEISRNSVSQYLNEFVKTKEVIKINSRPVYFFITKEIEAEFDKKCIDNIFSSFNAFMDYFDEKKRDFEKLIGHDNSLKNAVEQCKAAISYPGQGLPILIYGPTGTGKSMMANLSYEYALHHNIVESSKQFISINCSEYANNPELLTANLFGYVKGAYTGAEEDNEGLIGLSNGGILFLDEVHCLSASCQEKLFFFMDKGMYHKVGDNEHWYKSKCRLIFATTEDPQTSLLKTLLRRIPITVTLPALKERSLIEKKMLIYTIFKKESVRLGKEIMISNVVYQIFMDNEFIGNIGSLKNSIKAACASAFLSSNKDEETLNVKVMNIPEQLLKNSPSMKVKVTDNPDAVMISLDKLGGNLELSTPLLHLYETFLKHYKAYENDNLSFEEFIKKFKKDLQTYIDYIIYKNRYRKNANDDYLLKILDKIYSIVINNYSLNVSNSEIKVYSQILSEYSKYLVDTKVWIADRNDEAMNAYNLLVEKASREVNIAREIADNIAINLDMELDNIMVSILAMGFITYDKINKHNCVGVILCHGYSTASSIADAANRLIGEYIFDGIDMQLDISIDKIVLQLDEYLKRKSPVEEVMLLVDMGSLEEIYKRIKPIANCNLGLLNNVTTKMALEVGMGIYNDLDVCEIMKRVKKEYTLSSHYIEGKAKNNAILTICATGIGAAIKISELLKNSLPHKVPLDIVPYDYQALVENGVKDSIFKKYNVEMIVGTMDPKVEDYDYLPVESLMMNDGIESLRKIISSYLDNDEIKEFNENIMKNFTLNNIVNQLTILNAEKVIDDVADIVKEIENNYHVELDNTSKAGLYIHISCLIERLMLKNEIVYFDNVGKELDDNSEFARVVKEAFSGVEMRYSVDLPDAEIIFILNYFKSAIKS